MNFKKIIFIVASIFTMPTFYAQDITDALRYSQDNIVGSARYRALSGAFGALGGDLSATSLNPAGSAVFINSLMSFSLTNLNIKNDTQYFDGRDSNSDSYTEFTQIGTVFVFNQGNQNTAFRKFTLSFTYDRINDYKDDWATHGNGSNSIANYFLDYAQGLPLNEIYALENESTSEAYSAIGQEYGYKNQQAFLGYESYIIDPVNSTDENTAYNSNVSPGDFNQNYIYSATGYNGKMAVNLASQINDKLYLGINLNSNFLNYDRITYLTETNSNNGSIVTDINFENRLSTIGSGFSFQFGTIYKATQSLRLGLTYTSPTWYTIQEETTQALKTTRIENSTEVYQTLKPRVTNIHPDYKLRTPGKYAGSIAYVFGTRGLISVDYNYKDYGSIKFKENNATNFNEENNDINNQLKGASSFAIGGEYRIKQFSLRGGYRFEESPYKNGYTVGDLTGFSAGLGYSFGLTNLDLTFDQYKRDSEYQLYSVGLTDATALDKRVSNITLTLSFAL